MRIQRRPHNPDLELAFARESLERAARDTRWGVLNTLFMYPIFIPLDFLVYPEAAPTFVWIRLGVVALSIGMHFFMLLPFAARRARFFAMVGYLYCTLAIVLMVHLVDGYASPYYAGINLVLISFLFIVPLNVKQTAIVCVIVYAAYIVPIAMIGGIDDVALLVNHNFFLVSTMLLVVISSYLATNMRRKEFTSRFELARANDELKKLDVVKSQFFASISHEIRTPLTSIMAPTDSLFRGDVGSLAPVQRTLVGQVHRNALRLLDLINQMLDFAKFDAKKMRLHLKRVNFARVVRNQVALFHEVCRRKGLALECNVVGTVPVVFLDHEKVERILSNLIRNAIKFTDEGSILIELEVTKTNPTTVPTSDASDGATKNSVRIAASAIVSALTSTADAIGGTAPVSAPLSAPGSDSAGVRGWITLRVRDTGIGIAEHNIRKVFQRFQQVDGSTTRRYEGTGLGLAIVQEAVDLQRGSITVDSEEGEGTTFTVRLPINLDEIEPNADIDRRQDDRRQDDADFDGPDRRVKPRRNEDFGRISVSDIAFVESSSIGDPDADEESVPQTKPSTGIRILYVEDNTDLRSYVSQMLRSFGHSVETAVDGTIGWERAQELLPDIVVSDVMMPGIDGFGLVRLVKTTESTQKIPVILTTAKSETDARIEGLEIGADDYLAKPIDMRELDARVRNIIAARRFRDALTRAEELEGRVKELALGFSQSLVLRDGYTAGHSDDVLSYGTIITEALGIPLGRVLREALLLHDIGKLGIPDRILHKPAPLDAEEWVIMKRHPEMGAGLLSQFDSLRDVSKAIMGHHERYDGSGYPHGIAGEAIPLEARIIAIADAWHAMREDRTYRKAVPIETAVKELIVNRGRQFDPAIVDRFLDRMVERGMVDAQALADARAAAGAATAAAIGQPNNTSAFSPKAGR